MKTRCKKCGYEWTTKSQMLRVSCPSCGNKVELRTLDTPDTITITKGGKRK